MAESDFQRRPLTYAVEALGIFFAGRPDVYVSGNMFVYYEQGNPESVVAPDVFVVFGVPNHERRSYRVWEEGKAPDFVLEITSAATFARDSGSKRGTYAFLGVREYFQFDPTSDYLEPPLLGLRLVRRNYEEIPPTMAPDGTLSIPSQTLGLVLQWKASTGEFRFFDPARGLLLLTHSEEAAARRNAEAELERLRAELARLKGEDGR